MHRCALENLERAKALYVVHCDVSKIMPLDEVADKDLGDYLNHDDSRQLLHITYGFMLEQGLREPIYAALKKHRKVYDQYLKRHIGKHISLLGC